MATTTHTNATVEKKASAGTSWEDDEEQVVPKNNLPIVFLGLMCTTFLAALDQTIVATALPTIVSKLGGGNNYSWIGSSYLLAAGAFGPLYARLSSMFGRKPILHSSIVIFLFGSAMCGAAQNMIWLIVCRAIQGIGGGGIMQLVVIVISDIVPLKNRGRAGGLVGATYGIACVVGPLLGGVFAEHVSWRWCFLINIPTGGVAAVLLFIFLNLNPHQARPFADEIAEFDFIGLAFFVSGAVCLLIGFNFSQTSWTDAKTIALLAVGVVMFIFGGIYEMFTNRDPIVPPRLFKTRTTAIILISVFLYAIVFFEASYYLPLFYQILGSSATGSGIKMLPFSLGTALLSIVSGSAMSRLGKYRLIIWPALAIMTLGFGLMTMLDYNSSIARQEVFPLIASFGLGCMFQVPLVALQAAMPQKDMASATGAYIFLRTIGAAVGIAVGEAIISTRLSHDLPRIPGFALLGLGTTAAELNDSVGKVHTIPDIALRDAVLHAFSRAIDTIWIVAAPISGFSLITTFFLRAYSLDSKFVRGEETKAAGDLEQQADAVHDEEDVQELKSVEAAPSTAPQGPDTSEATASQRQAADPN